MATISACRSCQRPVPGRRPRHVNALLLGALTLGSAEYAVLGLVPAMAASLGVSVSAVGQLVTVYAIATAAGAVLLDPLTARWSRRRVITGGMAVFAAGNALAALAPGYALVIAARVVTGAVHGAWLAAATTSASAGAPPPDRARVIARVLSGLSAATAFGVPAGTWIGQHAGWRATFAALAALSVLATAAAAVTVPGDGPPGQPAPPPRPRAGYVQVLRVPGAVRELAAACLVQAGMFAAITYLSPLLLASRAVPASRLSVMLLAFGLASIAGSVLGGRWASRRGIQASRRASLLAASALLATAMTRYLPSLALPALILLGLAGFAYITATADALNGLAGDVLRPRAATLAVAAMTGGIALGAVGGGLLVPWLGISSPAAAGVVLCLAARLLTTRTAPRRTS